MRVSHGYLYPAMRNTQDRRLQVSECVLCGNPLIEGPYWYNRPSHMVEAHRDHCIDTRMQTSERDYQTRRALESSGLRAISSRPYTSPRH